jgi:Protein of unknown function (DUF2934)
MLLARLNGIQTAVATGRSAGYLRRWLAMVRRSASAVSVASAEFEALIAERAYFKAERRGFAPGLELEDWLAAERELSAPAAVSVAETRAKPKKSLARRRNGSSNKLK